MKYERPRHWYINWYLFLRSLRLDQLLFESKLCRSFCQICSIGWYGLKFCSLVGTQFLCIDIALSFPFLFTSNSQAPWSWFKSSGRGIPSIEGLPLFKVFKLKRESHFWQSTLPFHIRISLNYLVVLHIDTQLSIKHGQIISTHHQSLVMLDQNFFVSIRNFSNTISFSLTVNWSHDWESCDHLVVWVLIIFLTFFLTSKLILPASLHQGKGEWSLWVMWSI